MRNILYCKSFKRDFDKLSELVRTSASERIFQLATGQRKGRKLTIKPFARVVRRAELQESNRIIWQVVQHDLHLLFVGDHEEYDLYWQGKRALPSIDGTDWETWDFKKDAALKALLGLAEEQQESEEQEEVDLDGESIRDFLIKLTRPQVKLARVHATGPLLIQGVAGSGKTVLGLCRALDISQERAQFGKVTSILILTYSRALATALEWLHADKFLHELPNMEVKAFGDWMADCLRDSDVNYFAADNATRRYVVRQIRDELSEQEPNGKALKTMSTSFLLGEFDDIIRGREVGSLEEYLHIKRAGRRQGLNKPRRQLVWRVYQRYQHQLHELSMFDWAELPELLLMHCQPLPQYDVVIVDEAQDMRPNYLKLALRLVPNYKEHRSLTLLGDPAQSIHYTGISWRDA